MKAALLKASLLAVLLVAVSFVGAIPSSSDAGRTKLQQTGDSRSRKQSDGKSPRPLNYRSPGASHKLVISSSDRALKQRLISTQAVKKIRDIGDYSLVEISNDAISSLDADTLVRAQVRDDFNLVMLKRGQIDTTGPEPEISPELRQSSTSSRSLHLAQMFGPPTPESLEALKATGVKVVSYIPNNAYLVWATPAEIARVKKLRESSDVVQWDGPYHPAYKIDSHINLASSAHLPISIQLVDAPESTAALERIKAISDDVLMGGFNASGIVHIKVQAETSRIKEIASMAEVLAIEPWAKMHLMDERAGQIIAGAISTETVNNILITKPTAPGYLAYLNSLGFTSDFNFAVDVADTGFNTGSGDAAKVHPDLLNAAGASRVTYLNDFTNDSHADPNLLPTHDTIGHGTINASIIAGYNNLTGAPNADSLGFRYGLGIAPYVKLGVTKLFGDNDNFGNINSYADYIAPAYRNGARISSNSWGGCDLDNSFCNLYTDDCTEFDSLVRDADPAAFGNQSMTIVFAAGNDGDARTESVSTPGTSKNVITVGASENFRNGTDGCGYSTIDADNAQDIIDFSGYGPVQDGRAKPDIIAPGIHIQGAASQDPMYATKPASQLGVCNRFFPDGQTLYTWSTGTSHSTPIVAGAAALTFQWFKGVTGQEPSPAMVKALLLNSTRYMTGAFAGGNLPGAHQGWGLLDIGRMFEQTDRILYDESPDRTFTQSGGAPFQTTGVISDSSKEFRVMLIWTDPPGNASTNAPYVNQLNLEVVVGGVTYQGNNFQGQYSKSSGQADFVNNAQGVRLPAGTTGPFIVRVRPTVIAGDGVPQNGLDLDQDFALVVTNGREVALPVLATGLTGDVSTGVSVTHPNNSVDQALIPGETAKITVALNNLSATAPATITGAGLFLTFNNQTIGQTVASSYPVIQPGQVGTNSVPFDLQVPAGLTCGAVVNLVLQADTANGRIGIPVRVQVGRAEGASVTLLSDNVDSASVKWKAKKGFATSSAFANSGSMSYHIEDPGKEDGDNRNGFLMLKKGISIPANAAQVRLSFFHVFNFEPGYDGGVLEISDDDGTTWQDLGSRMIVGGYDGKVTSTSNNPLGNRFAWTARGRRGVFNQVVVNLDDFVGKRIRLRFTGAFDNAVGILDGYTGWFIDDVQITAKTYACK